MTATAGFVLVPGFSSLTVVKTLHPSFNRRRNSLAVPAWPSSVRLVKICANTAPSIDEASQSIYKGTAQTGRELKCQSHPLWREYPEPRSSPLALEPQHWINLTNGLELLPCFMLASVPPSVRFTRIQSSHCESSAYDKLLWSIDNDLLLSLAVGRPCYVYDLASRNKLRGVSRALFLGLQFIRWSLLYLWFGVENAPARVLVRGKNAVPYWRDTVMHHQIAKDTKKRIRYFMPYAHEMNNCSVPLHAVYSRSTEIDGCTLLHVKFLRQWLEDVELRGSGRSDANSNAHAYDDAGSERQLDWHKEAGLVVYDSDRTCEELREIQRTLNGETKEILENA